MHESFMYLESVPALPNNSLKPTHTEAVSIVSQRFKSLLNKYLIAWLDWLLLGKLPQDPRHSEVCSSARHHPISSSVIKVGKKDENQAEECQPTRN